MTALWGPLGWMTLHSVATSYPEVPTESETLLMTQWLDMFRDTITCPTCKEHFTTMLMNYRAMYPRFLANRQSFAIFTFRAHNAVNQRLHKPTYASVAECMAQLKKNIEGKSALLYRQSYLNHIARYWKTLQDVSGMIALKKVNEMRKIEIEYMPLRDTNFQVSLMEEIVIFPRSTMERTNEGHYEEPRPLQRIDTSTARGGLTFVGGRLRLRR